MNKVEQATKEFIKENIPNFSSGDTVSVEVKVKEGNTVEVGALLGVVTNGQSTEIEVDNEEKETQKTLHPLEIKFKQSFSRYKKIKFDYRKKREQEESKNLKIKQQIILDINKLTQEDESIKKTFEHFRILQEQWKNTGHVPQNENNNLWQSYHHHVELFYDFIKLIN